MDLTEFTSGIPATKPWLTIVAKSVTADTITANNFVTPPNTAFFSMIAFNTVLGPATGANLLINLSPNSRLTIPRNTMVIGDVYQLEMHAVISTPNMGDSATFDLAATSGAITTFPVIAPTVAGFASTPIIGRCTLTLSTPTTLLVQTTIGGFLGMGPPAAAGYSFGTAGVPFDSAIDQVLTFSYTSATFTSMQMQSLFLRLVASGTD